MYILLNVQILCETSMRHVHLSEKDLQVLFGKGAKLEFERQLSQPGQFLSKQRVTLVGKSGRSIENVGIIGPTRSASQVEISRTDSFVLGLRDVPLRLSGDLDGDVPLITIKNGDITVSAKVIIAKRHIHLDPVTAKKIGLKHGDVIKIKIEGARAAVLDQVIARVDKNFASAVHLDSDEANAVGSPQFIKIE